MYLEHIHCCVPPHVSLIDTTKLLISIVGHLLFTKKLSNYMQSVFLLSLSRVKAVESYRKKAIHMALTALIVGLALVNVLCVLAHVAPRLDTYRNRSCRSVYCSCDVLYMYDYHTTLIHSCQSTILNQNVYMKEGFFCSDV